MSITSSIPAAPPSAAETPPAPASVDGWPGGLAGLRAELDGIDDALHDLLMRRAGVVARLAASGTKGGVALRPGREADILRRLLARHAGPLPARVLPRIWRELFAGTTTMQAPHVIAVCDIDPGAAFTQAAREHFGALTPLRVHRSPAQALADVSAGAVTAAVLPLPSDADDARAAWWTALLHKDMPRIHVIARLPFWAPRPDGAPAVQALVVAAFAPDASAHDRSLLGLELAQDVSRQRLQAALATAGFDPGAIIVRRNAVAAADALVDVDGFITEEDERLGALSSVLRRPVIVGAYAIPLDGAGV